MIQLRITKIAVLISTTYHISSNLLLTTYSRDKLHVNNSNVEYLLTICLLPDHSFRERKKRKAKEKIQFR